MKDIFQKIGVITWDDMPTKIKKLIEPCKLSDFGIHNYTYLKWYVDGMDEHAMHDIIGMGAVKKVDKYLKSVGAKKQEEILIYYWW